jgi:hypothetical protein
MRETTAKRKAMRATTGVLESAQIGFFFLGFEKEVSCREGFAGQGVKTRKKRKEKENMEVMGVGVGVRVMISVDEANKRKRNEKVVWEN